MSAPQERRILNDDERFREWEQALAPYNDDVEKFAKEKGVEVRKWPQDTPAWHIGKPQKPGDLNKVLWSIRLIYDDFDDVLHDGDERKIGLIAAAWMDTEHDGRVFNSPESSLVAWWNKKDEVKIEELLQIAYDRATSITLGDLNKVSGYIPEKDGKHGYYSIYKKYNPLPQK